MMRNYSILLALLVALNSCETVIDVSLDSNDVTLISEAYLDFSDTSDTGHAHVYLTKSAPYFSKESNPPVSGATIVVNGSYILEESIDSLGYYSAFGIPKNALDTVDMRIMATINGVEGEWLAKDYALDVPRIDSIYSFYDVSFPENEAGYFVNIMAQEPAQKGHFYHIEAVVQDTVSFELNPGTKRSSIFTDEFINGMSLNFTINDEPLTLSDSVFVTLSTISENAYYYYFNLYTLLTESSGIGAAPPFELHGNVISQNDNFENAHGNFMVRYQSYQEFVITE